MPNTLSQNFFFTCKNYNTVTFSLGLTLLTVISPPASSTHTRSRHRVTGAPVTTVTLVLTLLPVRPQGTAFGAVLSSPARRTLALSSHMVTLGTIVSTVTHPLTFQAVESLGTGFITVLTLPAFGAGAPSPYVIT